MNGMTGEIAKAEQQTNENEIHMPLGVRAIALSFITVGFCGLAYGFVRMQSGRSASGLLLGLFALIGWAFLRRVNWVRVGVLLYLCVAFVFAGVGSLATFAPLWDSILRNSTQPQFAWQHFLGSLASLLLVLLLLRGLFNREAEKWFAQPAIRPFMEWNPRKWRFGIGSLMYITFLVAIVSVSLTQSREFRNLRAQRWLDSMDLTDSVYFPTGARNLPSLDLQQVDYLFDSDHTLRQVAYGVIVNHSLMGDPVIVGHVVFEVAKIGEQSTGGLPCRVSSSSHFEWSAHYHPVGLPEITFPGEVQIAEYSDGELKTSEMQITLLEFWSFYQHPDSEWSIEGIERYVKDLRKRVAERDRE